MAKMRECHTHDHIMLYHIPSLLNEVTISSWPRRSKLPCCEVPMERVTQQGTAGNLYPTPAKKPDPSHTGASRKYVLPTIQMSWEADSFLWSLQMRTQPSWCLDYNPVKLKRPHLSCAQTPDQWKLRDKKWVLF